jgi:hypothetical protein
VNTLRRRVSLKVLGKQNQVAGGDGEPDVDDFGPFPKTRSECSPAADTVPCPVDGCGAAVGVACGHFSRVEAARAHLRPCPWVRCKWHLYLDVAPDTGSLIMNFPNHEPWEIGTTCALDVAERVLVRGEEATLEEVGEVVNLTRERIRQVALRSELALRMGHSDMVEPMAKKLRVASLVKTTRFSPQRPAHLGPPVVGKCPTCKEQRRRVKGEWRCGCRRQAR